MASEDIRSYLNILNESRNTTQELNQEQLNEAPMGFLARLGNKALSRVGTTNTKAAASARIEADNKTKDLIVRLVRHFATTKQRTVRSLRSFVLNKARNPRQLVLTSSLFKEMVDALEAKYGNKKLPMGEIKKLASEYVTALYNEVAQEQNEPVAEPETNVDTDQGSPVEVPQPKQDDQISNSPGLKLIRDSLSQLDQNEIAKLRTLISKKLGSAS